MGERDHTRVDRQVIQGIDLSLLLGEAEQVARAEQRRPDLVVAALPADEIVAHFGVLFGAQRDDLVDGGAGGQAQRWRLLDPQPRHRPPARVTNLDAHLGRLAQEDVIGEVALDLQPAQVAAGPPPRQEIRACQHIDDVEDKVYPQEDRNGEQCKQQKRDV